MVPNSKIKAEVRPFDPVVILTFKEGPQKGEQYVLGYGPRIIGKAGSELSFADPKASEVSFELLPTKAGGVEFRTKNSTQIRLNGLSKESETIRTGDQLEIGQTLIEISLGR